MTDAVEAMARAMDPDSFANTATIWDGPRDRMRGLATVALRALLSPSVTDCETCAGRGYAYQCDDPADESIPCPAGCDHGQVTRPSLMRFNRIASEGDTR